MSIKINNLSKSVIFSIFVFLIVTLRFYLAEPGYSLDYDVYIKIMSYIDNIEYIDILRDAVKNSPYFYVDVTSFLQFEVGSVLIFKIFMSIFQSEQAVFGIVGGGAAALKAYAFGRFRVEPVAAALLLLASLVLLESNAIRLALAVSFLLMATLALRSKNWVVAICWIIAAYLNHVQVAIFIGPFLGVYIATRPGVGRGMRMFMLGAGLAAAVAFSYQLSGLSLSKLDDYTGEVSGAVGLNLVSLLGMAAAAIASWRWIGAGGTRAAHFSEGHRLWGAVIGSTIFALVLLVTLTSFGAVGDRVWQAAFLVFVPVSYWYIQESGWKGRDAQLFKLVLYTLLVSTSFLILVRYPLSNLLHPMIPWTDLRF